jgi:transposase
METCVVELPEDSESLKAVVRSLLRERDGEKQRADDLQVQNLRLQLELERYKKRYYGPCADRLRSASELAQLLLNFAEQMDNKPVHPGDLPNPPDPEEPLRRVKRRKGRRQLANFENLPVTTHVYELSTVERACPCCGQERKEIGADESWQIEYLPGHFERIQHVRRKYRCEAVTASRPCLPGLRESGREPADGGGRQTGDGDRQRHGWPGLTGLYRDQ